MKSTPLLCPLLALLHSYCVTYTPFHVPYVPLPYPSAPLIGPSMFLLHPLFTLPQSFCAFCILIGLDPSSQPIRLWAFKCLTWIKSRFFPTILSGNYLPPSQRIDESAPGSELASNHKRLH